MATIYEIADKYKFIQQMIEEGADPEVFAEALKAIDGEAAEKLEAYAMVIKNVDSDINGLDAEIKRLQERKKSMQNNVANMKEVMGMLLKTVEGNRLKTDKFTFSFRKSTKVVIDNIDMIPEDFVRKLYDVNKTDLKKYMERGAIVNGARLLENQSLSIR
ncbi:siphovirus Gp157 family protein [Lysinibacillus odysseyi]|uniref:Siphovirus Gp157 family protein n=1 Tax=Lysinibacillus odysseyi 34hs-1 = NBRC 100172 TaxID=1220589 RepID=A0A0A3J0L6_9BACI|nr:siphovirus Gp157 family protein [Lysinibacillus odysseyi]KGR88698.1 hypothetical protein CD32_01125 [Lysinibacillus odysseyi 34hs-1 = NBRC 100172]